jgi:hypothetical protein
VESTAEHASPFLVTRWAEKSGSMLVLAAKAGLVYVPSSKKAVQRWQIRSLLSFVLSAQIFRVNA